jgi:hypothetical protein
MTIPNIKYQIDDKLVKKIIGSQDNALLLLEKMGEQIEILEIKNLNKTNLKKQSLALVVKYWNYEICKDIIRNLFKQSKKYQEGINSAEAIQTLILEWKNLGFGNISWPFSQGQFDAFVQSLNSQVISRSLKDEKVKDAAVRYRRLKEINTARNDYLETLIFNKNENILPTLSHNKGVDFFVDGISFDQKVSRSVTKEFIRDKGENWREIAKQNPVEVAKYLYQYHDEGRFGAEPRLYIVYLDEDISVLDLKQKIDEIDISSPQEVVFEYKHNRAETKTYKTQCFVILLTK